jgi:hypothetical protein
MRCQTCGEELREGARFCPTCGTPTQAGAPTTPQTIQIRRTTSSSQQSPEAAAAPSEEETQRPVDTDRVPDPPEDVTQPSMPRTSEPSGRMHRDPGAGYDPVGPPRQAPQSRRGGAAPPTGAAQPTGARQFSTPSSTEFNVLIQRLMRLLRLDTSVFGELYADRSATIPAATFAIAVMLLSGIGGMLYISTRFGFDNYEFAGGAGGGEFFIRSVILGAVFGLVALAAWCGVTLLLLRTVGGVEPDIYGLARVFGVALAPLILALLLFLNDTFYALSLISLGGAASLGLIGVLEAVDVKPGPAWLATLAGFAAFVIILTFLGHGFRDYAPGFFAVPVA